MQFFIRLAKQGEQAKTALTCTCEHWIELHDRKAVQTSVSATVQM